MARWLTLPSIGRQNAAYLGSLRCAPVPVTSNVRLHIHCDASFPIMIRLKEAAAILAATISAIAALSATYLSSPKHRPSPPTERVAVSSMQTRDIEQIRIELERAMRSEMQISSSRQDSAPTLRSVDARLARLEKAIGRSPEKSLELPLIRRDVDALKESAKESNAYFKESLDRIYDLTKWLLGGLAVSTISLAVATFLKPTKNT